MNRRKTETLEPQSIDYETTKRKNKIVTLWKKTIEALIIECVK